MAGLRRNRATASEKSCFPTFAETISEQRSNVARCAGSLRETALLVVVFSEKLPQRENTCHPRWVVHPHWLAQTGSRLLRKQILQRIPGQSAKPCFHVPICPSPHHASRTKASEELCPRQPMEPRKKSSEYRVLYPVPTTRIGAIECDNSGLPSYPCHRAPHRSLSLLLCHYHGCL